MKIFTRHIAFLLLLVSAFFIVPKEVIHELGCHGDTIDIPHSHTTGIAVETVHHHCDVLQLFFSPFDDSVFAYEFKLTQVFFAFPASAVGDFFFDIFHSYEIRGPPSVT